MPNSSRVPKELQQEWDAKLAASGFQDLENVANKDGYIQHQLFSIYSPYLITPRKGEALHKLLETHKFSKPRDRELLRLHLEGYSTRAIQRMLALLWPPISQQRISQVLIELRKQSEAP